MSVLMCAPERTEQAPDREAHERRMRLLFQANSRPLYRYLLRLTHGQPEAAEDLLQETMLRAWRRVAELPVEAESLRRWLFTVGRNLTIDAARARQARPTEISGEDVSGVPAVDDFPDTLLERQVLHDALLQLTPEQRMVLVALYYRDASVAQTAAGIGIPEGTVRSRSFYALRTVREILGRESLN